MPAYVVTATACSSHLDTTRAVTLGVFSRERDAVSAVLAARAAARRIPEWHVSYAVIRESEHVWNENTLTGEKPLVDIANGWVLQLSQICWVPLRHEETDPAKMPDTDAMEDEGSEDSGSEVPDLVSASDSDDDESD